MPKLTMRGIVFTCMAITCTVLATACGSSTTTGQKASGTATPTSIFFLAALPGYQTGPFAAGTGGLSNPDAITMDSTSIYVAYQNTTAKDGSDSATNKSTVVQYSMAGKALKSIGVPGHVDGLRYNSSTHLVWATSNEDASPLLNTVDFSSGTVTPYTLAATPHGGGYDDVIFTSDGTAFMAASNPNLDASGNNVFPALVKVTLSGSAATLTPVLMGNDKATDTTTSPASTVTLNEIDPDSLSLDAQGNVVLVNQAGNELVTLSNPGTPQQKVTRIPVGTQLDDTVWATSAKGRLFVVDATNNAIYTIRANFTPNTIYTQAPNDSGVNGFVGTVDPKTGFVTPVVIGFGKATGMMFVPDA